jgi:hypothetical protein
VLGKESGGVRWGVCLRSLHLQVKPRSLAAPGPSPATTTAAAAAAHPRAGLPASPRAAPRQTRHPAPTSCRHSSCSCTRARASRGPPSGPPPPSACRCSRWSACTRCSRCCAHPGPRQGLRGAAARQSGRAARNERGPRARAHRLQSTRPAYEGRYAGCGDRRPSPRPRSALPGASWLVRCACKAVPCNRPSYRCPLMHAIRTEEEPHETNKPTPGILTTLPPSPSSDSTRASRLVHRMTPLLSPLLAMSDGSRPSLRALPSLAFRCLRALRPSLKACAQKPSRRHDRGFMSRAAFISQKTAKALEASSVGSHSQRMSVVGGGMGGNSCRAMAAGRSRRGRAQRGAGWPRRWQRQRRAQPRRAVLLRAAAHWGR